MSTELEKLAAAARGKLVAKADASARQYSLRQGDDGKMSCTCGDYKFRQAGVNGECKHIKAHRSSGARADGVPMIRDHVKEGVSKDWVTARVTSAANKVPKDRLYAWGNKAMDKADIAHRASHGLDSVRSAGGYLTGTGAPPAKDSPALRTLRARHADLLGHGGELAHALEAQKQGAEAALAKYAIEFKSPKMRAILQGAGDRAYQMGASPRLIPNKHREVLQDLRNKTVPQLPKNITMTASPDNHERLEGFLMTHMLDGLKARQARIASGNIPTTPREMASSIGRPRENAIRAMFKRQAGHVDEDIAQPRPNLTRDLVWGPNKRSPQNKFRDMLSDIHEMRSNGLPVEGILGDDGFRPRVNKRLLAQHTPDILQGMLAKKKGTP